jgi:hypothetical protein
MSDGTGATGATSEPGPTGATGETGTTGATGHHQPTELELAETALKDEEALVERLRADQAAAAGGTGETGATGSAEIQAAGAPALAVGAPARHPDGREGRIASVKRNGTAVAAVRLQIGKTLTDWVAASALKPAE